VKGRSGKMRHTVMIVLLLMIVSIFFYQTPEKDFESLYQQEDSIFSSLISFRKRPLKETEVNGVRWEYFFNTGEHEETILFIHGIGGAYDIWWQQIEVLSRKFNIISITLPEIHTLDETADGIVAILDTEKISKVNLVGTSMGGYIVQYLLDKNPDRISRLILGNTFPPNNYYVKENGTLRKVVPLIPEWVLMFFLRNNVEDIIPSSENSKLVKSYLLEQYYGLIDKKQVIGRFDIVLENFRPIRTNYSANIPKLIIESDNDPLVTEFLRDSLKMQFPEAEVFTFQGKGHFPYLNRPSEYSRVMDVFLNK